MCVCVFHWYQSYCSKSHTDGSCSCGWWYRSCCDVRGWDVLGAVYKWCWCWWCWFREWVDGGWWWSLGWRKWIIPVAAVGSWLMLVADMISECWCWWCCWCWWSSMNGWWWWWWIVLVRGAGEGEGGDLEMMVGAAGFQSCWFMESTTYPLSSPL